MKNVYNLDFENSSGVYMSKVKSEEQLIKTVNKKFKLETISKTQ